MGIGVMYLIAEDQDFSLMVEQSIAKRIPYPRIDGVDILDDY